MSNKNCKEVYGYIIPQNHKKRKGITMSKKNKRKNFRLPNGAGSVFKLSGNRRKPYTAVMSIGYTDQGLKKENISAITFAPF